ncbi:hypothetical protein ACLK1U_16740 [Escherichia coli]
MQVVRYRRERCVPLAGEFGTLSRSFLFDRASNIDTGTAYLAMLNNVYSAELITEHRGVMPSSPPITAAQAACCEFFRMIRFRLPILLTP